jgi:RNA binding exosome subunit
MLENKVEFTFTRDQVEGYVGHPIEDKQWEVLASEIETALEWYVEQETTSLWNDIDNLVEEDIKFD